MAASEALESKKKGDMIMTDKETITALDCCTKADRQYDCIRLHCPYYDAENEKFNCVENNALCANALDLINRQKAEIEDLKVELAAMRGAANSFKAEVDRLKDYNSNLIDGNTALSNEVLVSKAKAEVEAYEEFAEKLKEEWFCNGYDSPDVDFDNFIVNLLKEMVGEKE